MKTYRLVQFHTDTISPLGTDPVSKYYRKIWEQEHYYKPDAFWELPKWAGELSYVLNKAQIRHDFDVLTSPVILSSTFIFGSVLEANRRLYTHLIERNPQCTFILGGYVELEGYDNIIWCNSIKDACDYLGIEYEYGVDWSLFEGEKCIPRITMSTGCAHRCKFCTIPNQVIELPYKDIIDQVLALKPLSFDLVYIDDKTFGQCKNYTNLSGLYQVIKSFNPSFVGFIVQTTASQSIGIKWDDLHVYAAEIGVESYNDPILKAMNKPASERMIRACINTLKAYDIKYIANIIIGFPQETPATYINTLYHLKNERPFLANLYRLAVYEDSVLGQTISTANENDSSESNSEKSYNTEYKNKLDNNAINMMAKYLLKQ